MMGRRFAAVASLVATLAFVSSGCATSGAGSKSHSGRHFDFFGAAVPGDDKADPWYPKVAEWQGMEPRHVADLLLRAAWCCVDEGDIEAERYFRRRAAWKFEEALSSFDGVAREERAVLTYLVGELWRRIGDVRQANAWFNRVQSEIGDPSTQQWVIDAARQQRDCPREWFG